MPSLTVSTLKQRHDYPSNVYNKIETLRKNTYSNYSGLLSLGAELGDKAGVLSNQYLNLLFFLSAEGKVHDRAISPEVNFASSLKERNLLSVLFHIDAHQLSTSSTH